MTAPLLQQTLPADNSTGVSVSANLGLGFNQAIKAGSGYIRIYKADGTLFHSIAITDTSQVTFSTTQVGRVIINPNIDLVPGTGYYVLVDAGAIENLSGEDFAGISAPTTLNFSTSGSPPGDTTAPLLNSTTPADNATGVAVGSNLVLTFNEAVKAGTGLIVIHNALDGSTARVISASDTSQVSFSGSQVQINPATDLAENHAYYVTLTSDALRDLANNNFAGISSSTAFNFTTAGTADTTAPILTNTSPADNAISVAPGADIVLTFNEAVQAGFGNVVIRYASNNIIAATIQIADDGQVQFSGNQVTIDPLIDLTNGETYYVTIDNGAILDAAGNAYLGLSGATTFNFTTASVVDTTAPLLGGLLPADDAANVPVSTNLGLDFDEAVKAGTGNIEIRKLSDGSLVQAIAITDATQVSISGNHITINPSANLAGTTEYYVTFGSGVVLDLANNAFAGITSSTTFNFMTADTVPPVLASTSPTDNASDVYPDDNLVLSFNETILIGAGNIEIRKSSDGSIVRTIAVTDGTQVQRVGASLVINPNTALDDGTSYYVTFGSGVVTDLYGNAFPGISSPTTFNFSTVHLGTPSANTLTGDSGNNAFDGGIGHDTLSGGLGDDTYFINNYEGGETTILLQSEAGDWIGAGETVSLPVAGDYELYAFWDDANDDGLADSIRVHYDDDIHFFWEFRFDTISLGTNIVPGTYIDATSAIRDNTPGHPGLEVFGNSRGSFEIFGSFTVTEAVFDYSDPNNPVVISLAITFEQHSGDPDAPALYGVIHYNYAAGGMRYYDTIVENPGGGTDTVKAAVSYVLGDNLENLFLTSLYDIDGWGNALNNVITGNNGNNFLDGAAGDDTLAGGSGVDTFNVVPGAGNDVIVDFAAGAGIGDVTNLDGFALNTFTAVQSAMSQSGSDTVLDLGNGQTLTFLNLAPSAFAANDFTFLDLPPPPTPPTPPPPSNPTPFTLPVSGAYTNTINGSRRADTLNGTAANNRLDGKQGNDTMTGYAGDDTYLVDASGDVVVETGGNGIDTVISSAPSYALANAVENLTLTGTSNHTATGNGLNNLIIASNRPDIINGGAGNDIIRAGTGACVLTGGSGNDMFDFDVMGSQKQITDFAVAEDLVDLRTLLAWYGGSNPVADNALAVTAVAGGVLVSVKAGAGGTLQGLVKITGVSVGDLDIGGDILWDA